MGNVITNVVGINDRERERERARERENTGDTAFSQVDPVMLELQWVDLPERVAMLIASTCTAERTGASNYSWH